MTNPEVAHVYRGSKPDRGLGRVAWLLLLWLFLSAFALVYVKDLNRRLSRDYQQLQHEYLDVQTQWEKLLLEQSVWVSQERIAQLAQEHLGMRMPRTKEISSWSLHESSDKQL
jgi:cell division protein FtsL